MASRIFDILLVEDNPGDVELIREALAGSSIACQIHLTEDGEEALKFLHRSGAFVKAPRPDLILLDLNLPRKDGKEVLREIKSDAGLRTIPTIIMTSSETDRDIAMCYALHANCYLIKPADLQGFLSAVESVVKFWLDIAKLPPKDAV